ncbi:MAG: metallopeptidase family protein [Propionibacteriaceae bacterium]|jgi:predicted Zn-dependent protease with MMP-like domain|nr:metallopeptidase family protein [Propionibacteriaceae bacterium]
MAVEISDADFDEVVSQALDQIPAHFMDVLDNVVVLVEDEPDGPEKDLLGLYEGVPLSERDSQYGAVLPDHIFIYRGPLKRMCSSTEELVDEIGITVVHEIAHFFGIEDDHLHETGWG